MIENEQQEEAVKVVTALGRLFRISLSKGKRIIPLKNEIEHVTNYLMIQQVRFENKFSYSVTMEEGIGENATLKLIVHLLWRMPSTMVWNICMAMERLQSM